jgi:pimeloyl-ACP methyl ester carboxylesterase
MLARVEGARGDAHRMATTHYAKSEGASLAYRVDSEDGTTLLHVPGALSNLALEDTVPAVARYFERLSRFCRLIRFDKRGTGLSDRGNMPLTVAEQVPDVEAVRKATQSERVALYGLSQGATVAVLYGLAFPERVTHLILVEGICCDARDPYRPITDDNKLVKWDDFFGRLKDDFEAFSREFSEICFPGGGPQFYEGVTNFLRATASPTAFESLWRGIVGLDLRFNLKNVAMPTLVLHASGDQHHPVQHGRYFAEHIPGARYVELESPFHVPYMDEAVGAQMLTAIEEFLTGSVRHTAERRFAAVLFTDIVDSTAQQNKRGDRAWRSVLESHEADARRLAEQFGGCVAEVQGDGVMATFPTAGEGIRAARAMVEAARDLGVQIRAGLHAGEVYEVGERLLGICVNIAARVVSQAGADQILTTELVQGLVEGSGFAFVDTGEFELKGIGPRRLFRVA